MTNSQDLFVRAQRCLPAGVNSPVRAFQSVGGEPIFYGRGDGAYLYDSDNQRYLDYVCSWGAIILGHANDLTLDALHTAIANGLGFGAPSEIEVLLAEKITSMLPSLDCVRMVNSGTEATMTAIRIARGATGKNKIIKFDGCYHGHSDSLLVKAGSGALTFGVASSAGVPEDLARHTLVANYNNLDSVERYFQQHPNDIAGIIVEPIAGNMNFIQPKSGFLKGLRELCNQYGSLLIFDEVMTGFRVDIGCAQGLYEIEPDLTTLGKVIGGGLPAAAVGGRWQFMEKLAPLGPVYQAGTLSGSPIAMTAGLVALDMITEPGFYQHLDQLSQQLVEGITGLGQRHGIPVAASAIGGMMGFVFTDKPTIETVGDVANSNISQFNEFFHAMLQRGINLPPSAFETCFITRAHTEQDVAHTLNTIDDVFTTIKS